MAIASLNMAEAPAYPLAEFSLAGIKGISPESMQAHLELYKGYVKEANAIAAALGDAKSVASAAEAIRARESLARRFAFEVSGVRLHEWFFEQFTTRPTATPGSDSLFAEAISTTFGSFSGWTADVKAVGKIRGPGWVASYWDPRANRLTNAWIDLHHLAVPAGQSVLFVLDLWEHAYWTDFGAKGRDKYMDAVLTQTDWTVMDHRIEGSGA